ncbi:hypothetical protein G3576_04225 [Roseomonas stagni]|uniref:Immunity MXAN-0049 protein domain-containing protein n=1 Tax=Falsiroseomonas algicola TaxID=2716930 RepID=A0A6M1LG29_9PROT|nr:DUF1629 domain-containing protein [Falsiroseomonas algicola]NGM19210.1 hypothetical protein [Falsiroseomonas algicola]
MNIARDAYEELCRVRDALYSAPEDGPERSELHMDYLRARLRLFKRAEPMFPALERIPAMNRRFFVMGPVWDWLEGAPGEDLDRIHGSYGRGWDACRHRPPLRLVPSRGLRLNDGRPPTLLAVVGLDGAHILPRPLLDVWQSFDPAALDILPVHVEGLRDQSEPEGYFCVDIIRCLPAFDLAAMDVFAFRPPKPLSDTVEYFPHPRVFALRDDLPAEGVHLFRDLNWRGTYFVSAELRQACLDAGFTDLPLRPPQTPE